MEVCWNLNNVYYNRIRNSHPFFLQCYPASRKQLLQTDYLNLKQITEELESALKELKSNYARRIMRNVK